MQYLGREELRRDVGVLGAHGAHAGRHEALLHVRVLAVSVVHDAVGLLVRLELGLSEPERDCQKTTTICQTGLSKTTNLAPLPPPPFRGWVVTAVCCMPTYVAGGTN